MKINNALDYVVKQILNKNCTIVLGAGISLPSEGLEDNYHHVEKMKENIKERLSVYEEKDGLSILSQRLIWLELEKNFPKSSEGFQETYKTLIKTLKIPEFIKLKPTHAHYFIAFIAREGLISEIITTNYDCNMENAYLEITTKEKLTPNNQDNLPVVRIYNNNTFSRFASKKVLNNNIPILKVFKINGCAFAEKKENAPSKSILLTETQLQNWRERKWAADFFRLKLRMSSLFFIGYGSDEPQVLHTIQHVFEENEGNNNSNNNDIYSSTNAPIVAVYEKLSFVHEYITKQYCLYNGYKISDAEKLLITPEKVNDSEEKLSADKLTENIYQKILKKLIEEAILYCSKPQNASFTAFIPFAEKHLNFMLKKLSFFAPIIEQYNETNNIPYPLIILMLNYLEGKTDDNICYIPISENKELVSELLFTLFCLYFQFDNQNGLERIKAERTNFNALTVYNDDNSENQYYFSSIPVCFENSDSFETENSNKNYKVVFLIGKNNFKYRSHRCFIKFDRKPDDYTQNISYKMIIIQINYRTIFSYYENNLESTDTYSLTSIKEIIQDAIIKPSKYVAHDRPSIRERLKNYKSGGNL